VQQYHKKAYIMHTIIGVNLTGILGGSMAELTIKVPL